MVRKRTACANRCAAAAAGGVTSLFGATSTCRLRRRTALTVNTAMTTATISTATPDDFLIGPPECRRNSRPAKVTALRAGLQAQPGEAAATGKTLRPV